MGVLNVTPDSFSDGGLWLGIDDAIAHTQTMIDQGAAVIDVGGESTRPGAEPVDEATELRRVIPVIERIHDRWPETEISVDTSKATVARVAIRAGATIINDVSASLAGVAADTGTGWIAMHAGGPSRTMQDNPSYGDVVAEVAAFLEMAVLRAQRLGVGRVWADPGFGFGKSLAHNLTLAANIARFVNIAPVVFGVSRKTSIGCLHAMADGTADPEGLSRSQVDTVKPSGSTVGTDDRIEGSLALATWAAHHGVDMVRVHDVRATVHALSVVTS